MLLLSSKESYRVETEDAAKEAIEQFRVDQAKEGYTIKKISYTRKTKTSKGEIIDEWYKIDVEKTYEE